jgi:hypothetical protein
MGSGSTHLGHRLIMTSLTALAALLLCSGAIAQPRLEPQIAPDAVAQPVTDPAEMGAWLQRLVGQFRYEGHVEHLLKEDRLCAALPPDPATQDADVAPRPPDQPLCTGVTGTGDCIRIGDGPGVQCVLGVDWQELFDVDFENGEAKEVPGFVPYMNPAMNLYGLDPAFGELNHLLVSNKGLAEGGGGSIKGDRATFTSVCVNQPAGCRRIIRLYARSDANIVGMTIDIELLMQGEWKLATSFTLTLRRTPRDEAAEPHPTDVDVRMRGLNIEDPDVEGEPQDMEALAAELPVTIPPVSRPPAAQQQGKSLLTLDVLDEVVAESEHERQRKASAARVVNNPDVITVTRDDNISARLQTLTPQSEIRFRRQSTVRQAGEGVRPPMQLHPDRLTAGDARLFRDVTFEFAAGMDETDGLPAVIPFGATTSLFNIDYVYLRNSMRPTVAYLRNVIDPETRRCTGSLGLGDEGEDFPNRFILMGRRLADCNRAVRSREGDLMFADGVPEQLRQELRELYEPMYTRFARNLGSEPGILFVVWRPDSPRSDFRLEFSLNRTNLLVFNGPSWQQPFTPQQRDALWEELALEQIVRRLRWQGEPDAVTESAVNYLLDLAKSERQQSTSRWLTTQLPEWIAGCARAMSIRERTANPPKGVFNYDCGLVLQFVYDAAIRAKSRGEDSIYRTWRTLFAESFRRGQSGVQPAAFFDSSADARRIVQGLLGGSMDWNAFVADMGKLGVQLRVAPSPLGPALQVLSLTHFGN